MRQRIIHGAVVDIATPDEISKLIPRPPETRRQRIPANVQLDASGNGEVIVWDVPAGMRFEMRRIFLTLTGSVPSDPNTGNVALNVAGKYVALLRSDTIVEYLQPQYGATIQVPGVQTWSKEQGPFFANKEVIQIAASGLTADVVLNVYVEGILEVPADAAR